MTEPTLAQRFQRLEDIEAIKDLTARYATAVNKGWNGKTLDLEAIPSIFATDARWKSRDMGIATEGLDAVVAGLPESIAACSSPQHARLALRRRCDAALKPKAGQTTVRRNHSRTGGATSSSADSATIQCGLPGWS